MKIWIKRSLFALLGTSVLLGGLAACGHRDHEFGASMSAEKYTQKRDKMVDKVAGRLDLNVEQKKNLQNLGDTLYAQRTVLIGQTQDPRAEMKALVAGDKFDAVRAQALITDKTTVLQSKSPEVIAAMERTEGRDVVRVSFFRRAAIPLAAAAGIALAFFITRPASPTALVRSGPVPIEAVQAGFIRTYQSPLFSLDEKREDHRLLVRHLRERKLPCAGCLPRGLKNVKGIGCRELVIDGKRGSLICFDERENGVVHVVIFRREDVCGELPEKDRPRLAQIGDWASAQWQDGENVFVAISHTQVEKLAGLF